MSSELGLGRIITTPQKRDAIHVAVVPTVAQGRLFPAQRVTASGDKDGKHVGIVDPFLNIPVEAGQTFWLYLFPGSVTSLRHAWTHPEFADE